MRKLAIWITTLGVGFFPKAPGTIGTLLAVGIYLLLPASFLDGSVFPVYGLLTIVLGTLLGAILTTEAEKTLGHDPGCIVLDEVIGFFFSVIWLPFGWHTAVLGFIFFRIFDIWKPEPVNMLQKLPAGWGVMIDDLMAAVYANIAIRIVFYFIP